MCQSVMSHALVCESLSIESLSTELSQITYNLHGIVISCHCMIFCMVFGLHPGVVKQQFTRIG